MYKGRRQGIISIDTYRTRRCGCSYEFSLPDCVPMLWGDAETDSGLRLSAELVQSAAKSPTLSFL